MKMLLQTSFHEPPLPGTIWESAYEFEKTYPIYFAAVCTMYKKLHENAENKGSCLAGSYAQCCSDTFKSDECKESFLELLRSMKGKFFIEEPDNDCSRKEEEEYSYGYADADGITVNVYLCLASSALYLCNPKGWMHTFDGQSIFYLMQQTIEHELGHRMNHLHGRFEETGSTDPTFSYIIPKKAPLCGESGFHVQEMAQLRASNDSSRRGYKSYLLEIQDIAAISGKSLVTSNFSSLLNKVFFSVVEQSQIMVQNIDEIIYPQTTEDLTKYMNSYIDFDDGNKADQQTMSSSKKRSRSSKGATTPLSQKRRHHPRSLPLDIVSKNRIEAPISVLKKDPPAITTADLQQTETSIDWNDRNDGYPLRFDKADLNSIMNGWSSCDISVRFCDENRKVKGEFVVGEPVYALIEFTNNTENTKYIPMDRKTLDAMG